MSGNFGRRDRSGLRSPKKTVVQPPLHFRDVVVSPYTELLNIFTGGSDHKGGPAWPDWDSQTLARHCRLGVPADIEPDPVAPVATIDGPVAWGGPVTRHFGHQIADFSMRLLPTARALPGVPVAFASHPRFEVASGAFPDFFGSILDWFEIPRRDVIFISEPTLIRHLIVLPQIEQLERPGPDSAGLDMLDALVERRIGTLAKRGTVYVSRAAQVARFAGEEYLETALAASGVTILRPENIQLIEQLRTYASADVLIFAEGSALFALRLLGRGLGDVVVINRRETPTSGFKFCEKSLEPRVQSLTYVDARLGLVHPLRPSGMPATEYGLAFLDPRTLLEALSPFGLEVNLELDVYRRAQGEDLARWLASLDPSWTSSPEAMNHLVGTIRELNQAHLLPI
jgi:hypothetical protein